MNSFINLDLLRNPYNWVSVILMVTLGLALLAIVSPQPSDQ